MLEWSKSKAFAENNSNVAKKMTKFVFDRVKDIEGEAENAAWLPAISFFLRKFSKGYFLKLVKSRDCVVKCLRLGLCVKVFKIGIVW